MSEENPLIVIVDNHKRSGQLYSVGLEAYVGATVVEFGLIEEAVEFLSSNSPAIIITRGLFDQRDAGVKFAQMIETGNLKIHLIVIGQTKVSIHQATIFDENVEVRDIIKKCASLLGVTAKAMAEKDVGEYYPIRLSLLCPNLSLVCPIYKKNANGEFVKFLEAESKIHPEILTILQSSGDKEIYVQAAHRLKFVNSISMFLAEMMADDRLTLEDTIMLSNNSYNIVRDSARRMMISPVTIQATEANINTMMSITGKIPKLNQFLKMTTSKVNFVFKHSLLTCFVASHIIDKMEWGTNDQKVKIAFVCFFSNLLLNQDDYILVHSKEDMDLMNLSDSERENIINHPINAAKIMSKYYTSLPFGVETIVKQHHGNRYGNDFAQNPATISPLALVYIISDEWVTLILKAERRKLPLTRAESLSIIKNKYKGMMFQEIIGALNDLTI
jgi:hypothetical protein